MRGSTSASYTTQSARARACSAKADSSPGSPGPAPTSQTLPGPKSGRPRRALSIIGLRAKLVIPAKAGIQELRGPAADPLDPRFRGGDDNTSRGFDSFRVGPQPRAIV